MKIGFSTGALAYGDFQRGLELCREAGLPAVELSALRRPELPGLVDALVNLDLQAFEHVSLHAPSGLTPDNELEVIGLLAQVAQQNMPIVVHPDAMHDLRAWQTIEHALLIENMDKRKPVGRTAEELALFLDALPEAGVCLDLGHARQVDPSMTVAYGILERYGSRIRQLHISEVNTRSGHDPLSFGAIEAFQRVADLVPEHVPVILESTISPSVEAIRREVVLAERALCGAGTVPRQHATPAI